MEVELETGGDWGNKTNRIIDSSNFTKQVTSSKVSSECISDITGDKFRENSSLRFSEI